MSTTIVPPTERECERCGRVDVWDDERMNWTIREDDGEKLTGDPQCIHEWDINGSYNPFESEKR
ncbi:MAG: HEWD family protein [Halapricum sp.]